MFLICYDILHTIMYKLSILKVETKLQLIYIYIFNLLIFYFAFRYLKNQ